MTGLNACADTTQPSDADPACRLLTLFTVYLASCVCQRCLASQAKSQHETRAHQVSIGTLVPSCQHSMGTKCDRHQHSKVVAPACCQGLLLRPGISATFPSKLRAAPPGSRKRSAPTPPAPARHPRPEGGCRCTAASRAAHARALQLSSPGSAAAARPCSTRKHGTVAAAKGPAPCTSQCKCLSLSAERLKWLLGCRDPARHHGHFQSQIGLDRTTLQTKGTHMAAHVRPSQHHPMLKIEHHYSPLWICICGHLLQDGSTLHDEGQRQEQHRWQGCDGSRPMSHLQNFQRSACEAAHLRRFGAHALVAPAAGVASRVTMAAKLSGS